MTRRTGFTIVEVIIVIAVIGLAAVVGWRVWEANKSTAFDHSQAGSSSIRPASEIAPKVSSDADLDKADKALDATNIDGTEAKQLDAETNF